MVGVTEDQCLAVALPVVRKEALQIDFPGLARKMMADKQAVKGAIRHRTAPNTHLTGYMAAKYPVNVFVGYRTSGK